MISFPAAPHDDQVDAFTQALSYMRGSYFDSADFQETGAMQARYFARRRREAAYAGSMINNVADADAIEYGETTSGPRYTNPGRLSRLRGGW